MKTDGIEKTLLLDYYGELLTEKQRTCFDLYYNQDLSLGEIAENEGISRQGVYDTLLRTQSILENLEEKLGCVARARKTEQACRELETAARELQALGGAAGDLAQKVLAAAHQIKE